MKTRTTEHPNGERGTIESLNYRRNGAWRLFYQGNA